MLRLFSLSNISLKFRLNLLISAAFAVSIAVGGMFAVHNYRRAVSTETEASAQLALRLVDATGNLSFSPAEAAQFRGGLTREIPALTEVRHVRLEVFDAAGKSLTRSPVSSLNAVNNVPRWFVRLIEPQAKSFRVPIVLNGTNGFLVVTTDPDDEVVEQWTNTRDLLSVFALLFFCLWMLVIRYISYALRPLDYLHSAFEGLGRGESARAPVLGAPELARVNRKFNEMAETLEHAYIENRILNQRLIELRDEESRALARQLHDNLAQYLFAIRTDAFAIGQVAATTGTEAVGSSARSISESAAQMEAVVREMIQQLRPLVLDELGLEDALRDMIASWRTRNPRITCSLHIETSLRGTLKEAELAIYYVVQESLTNVAKHSGASAATVVVRKATTTDPRPEATGDSESLEVTIEDNGDGISATASGTGMGLVGMRERVESLGGRLEIAYRSGCGWLVTARLPGCMKCLANAA
jgi:two-component system, NarL family, sensor histidine kinase UhpB